MFATLSRLQYLFAAAAIIAFSAALSVFAGWQIGDELEAFYIEQLDAHIETRADHERHLFDEAERYVTRSETLFLQRLSAMDDDKVEAEFDRFFPLREDGTRRSVDALFDGLSLGSGDAVRGLAAFMGDGADMDVDRKRQFLTAFHVVRSVGEAYQGRFDSLYFFNRDRQVVIFDPNRDDELMFYRHDAPADFDLRGDDDARLFSSETNPDGRMLCSPLSRYLSDDVEGTGDRAMTSCRVPVHVDGELVGGFGTSIRMDGHFRHSMADTLPHGVNLVMDLHGDVLVRGRSRASTDTNLPADTLSALLASRRGNEGVIAVPGHDLLMGYVFITGPDWYFVSLVDTRHVSGHATSIACLIFLMSTLVGLIFLLTPPVVRWIREHGEHLAELDGPDRPHAPSASRPVERLTR